MVLWLQNFIFFFSTLLMLLHLFLSEIVFIKLLEYANWTLAIDDAFFFREYIYIFSSMIIMIQKLPCNISAGKHICNICWTLRLREKKCKSKLYDIGFVNIRNVLIGDAGSNICINCMHIIDILLFIKNPFGYMLMCRNIITFFQFKHHTSPSQMFGC